MLTDIKSILETAISEEMKASRFYSYFALQMEDKGARLKFEIMAAVELKHYDFLLAYYQEKFKQTPALQESAERKIVRPETEYNYMTESTIRFASEDIPWMMEVAWSYLEFSFYSSGFQGGKDKSCPCMLWTRIVCPCLTWR